MKRKLPLIFTLFCVVAIAFSQEKAEKTYVYTSADTKGYISIKKTDVSDENGNTKVTLQTTVNADFKNETMNFSLLTDNKYKKMVTPTKLVFDGTMDSNIKAVQFIGERIKKGNGNASYWAFKGDYKDEAVNDAKLKPYIKEKYSSTLRMPERTIPSFNLWAVIPQLPFDREGTFIFNSLDETKLYVSKNQTVNYLGKYEANINGNKTELHKFVLQGKGMSPSYFWVDDNRELVQVLLDNEYTFTLDKNAQVPAAVALSYE